MFKLF